MVNHLFRLGPLWAIISHGELFSIAIRQGQAHLAPHHRTKVGGFSILYNVRPPFDSVQLVNITPISLYGLWYANNYSYWGESKPTNITGGPHLVAL